MVCEDGSTISSKSNCSALSPKKETCHQVAIKSVLMLHRACIMYKCIENDSILYHFYVHLKFSFNWLCLPFFKFNSSGPFPTTGFLLFFTGTVYFVGDGGGIFPSMFVVHTDPSKGSQNIVPEKGC